MANIELLARHKETRNVYLRNISNNEWEAPDVIFNFQRRMKIILPSCYRLKIVSVIS